MVQLSHLYMSNGKTVALAIRTLVGEMMSLFFNMLSRFIIAFLSKSESFDFMAAVTICSDFGAQENKTCHSFHFFPYYLPWSEGTGWHDLSFLNVEFQASFCILLFHSHQEALLYAYYFFLSIFHTIALVFQLHLISLAFYCSLNLLFLGKSSYLVPATTLSWCLFSLSFWIEKWLLF